MYGLPSETAEGWEYDLQQALQLQPEHISAYHLIYEENTALWTLREQHRVEEADEDLSVTLFKQLIHRLKEHGYQHYEISISRFRAFIPVIIPATGPARNTWDADLLLIHTMVPPANGTLLHWINT